MDLLGTLRPDLDMRISGMVTYVGHSSMEVTVSVESTGDPAEDINQWVPIIKSRFTMVARSRNPTADRIKLGSLIADSTEEQRLIASGEGIPLQVYIHIFTELLY
jgi:acyl-coenzyme A thioesterase 9